MSRANFYVVTGVLVGAALVGSIGAWSLAFGTKKDKVVTVQAAPSDSVWVYKKDGGTSCGTIAPQSLEGGAEELKAKNVQVLEQKKGDDGKARAQMCGIEAGGENAYLIRKQDLPQAIALGYHERK